MLVARTNTRLEMFLRNVMLHGRQVFEAQLRDQIARSGKKHEGKMLLGVSLEPKYVDPSISLVIEDH